MADLVYLSLWLRDYNGSNMLHFWKRVLEAFPMSRSAPWIRSLTVYPFDWGETPVLERNFGEGTTAEEAAILAGEFLHDDYAYEAELIWDLWVPSDAPKPGGTLVRQDELNGLNDMEEAAEADDDQFPMMPDAGEGWRLAPRVVTITCIGPGFEDEGAGGRVDLQVNLGLDSPFLPPEEPDEDYLSEPDPDLVNVRTRQNLQQLVAFVHRLDEVLPIAKRLLWCETGENLADKILDAWNMRL